MPDETPFETEARVIQQAREHQRRTQSHPRRPPVFAILAAISFAVGYIETGNDGHTNTWFSPTALILAGLFFLALHLLGIGTSWPRKPQ